MEYFNKYDKLLSRINDVIENPVEQLRYQVINEKKDRFQRIDTHTIWSIAFFESVKYLKEDNNILAAIGLYYSIFHCTFAYMILDLSIEDGKFETMHHSRLFKMLKNHFDRNLVTEKYLNFFGVAKDVREYINYFGAKKGFGKFKALKYGLILEYDLYGECNLLQINNKILNDTGKLINEYVKILKNIENKTNRYLFGLLHMNSDFDYYGEDFLESILLDGDLKENITHYLFELEE
jgi:hypothetical protein